MVCLKDSAPEICHVYKGMEVQDPDALHVMRGCAWTLESANEQQDFGFPLGVGWITSGSSEGPGCGDVH